MLSPSTAARRSTDLTSSNSNPIIGELEKIDDKPSFVMTTALMMSGCRPEKRFQLIVDLWLILSLLSRFEASLSGFFFIIIIFVSCSGFFLFLPLLVTNWLTYFFYNLPCPFEHAQFALSLLFT